MLEEEVVALGLFAAVDFGGRVGGCLGGGCFLASSKEEEGDKKRR